MTLTAGDRPPGRTRATLLGAIGEVQVATALRQTVVIPTCNERENITTLLDRLVAVLPESDTEIVFVDDSTDDTYSTDKEYLGYHDAASCYVYNDTPAETPLAGQTRTDYKRFMCQGAAVRRACADAFSGNFLNWASGSAIDMLRLALSGGDRFIDTRELTVLRLLASHLSTREIATALDVTPNTVKSHVKSVYRKLGVASRSEAVDTGRRCGLIARPAELVAARS